MASSGVRRATGGQDAEGVGGEHHDRRGVAGALLRDVVGDRLQRIGAAGVLGDRVVVQVEASRRRVHDHVLEHRPEGVGRGVDLRLRVGREADDLGVAAALDVEDAVLAPAVLVVADQRPLGVGGEGRLARARQPEEDGHAPVGADVGRAVHREHAALGQAVVHQGEDRLLDLAGVGGAADQDLLVGEVQAHEVGRAGAVGVGVGGEARGVEHQGLGPVGRRSPRRSAR